MTTRNASTSMGRGRDTLPLHPIPKTKPGRLHKSLDTPCQRVEDADSHEPIDGAVVQLAGISFGSALTNAKGEALLNFVYPSESLTVRRDGYRTETQFLSQSVMSKIFPIITIDLHRVPK